MVLPWGQTMIAMIEAARTTVSPAGVWALVIVAVCSLTFWLTAVNIAARSTGSGRHRRTPETPAPATGPAPSAADYVPGPRTADADQPEHQSR